MYILVIRFFGGGPSASAPPSQKMYTHHTYTHAPEQEGGEGGEEVVDGAEALVALEVGREEAQPR